MELRLQENSTKIKNFNHHSWIEKKILNENEKESACVFENTEKCINLNKFLPDCIHTSNNIIFKAKSQERGLGKLKSYFFTQTQNSRTDNYDENPCTNIKLRTKECWNNNENENNFSNNEHPSTNIKINNSNQKCLKPEFKITLNKHFEK